MKKVILSILAITGLCTFLACSNGDYVANPVTVANQSDNPLNFLTTQDQFSWSGNDAISAKINGTPFFADSLHAAWTLDSGYNIIAGYGAYNGLILRFKNVYSGGIYPFGTLTKFNDLRNCLYYDTTKRLRNYISQLGNVGEVYIITNDTFRIKGKFYFQALDTPGGNVINVTEGYFNVKKF